MKKLLTNLMLTALLAVSIANVVTAADAPPSVDLGGLLGGDEAEAPPQADLSGLADNPDPVVEADQPAQDAVVNNAASNNGGGANSQIIDGDIFSDVRLIPTQVNPTIQDSRIAFTVEREAQISIEVFDAAGNRVALLADKQEAQPNSYSEIWSPEGIAAGNYTYRLTAFNLRDGAAIDIERKVVNITYGSQPVDESPAQQNLAANVIASREQGDLSQTGPTALLYLLFPALGLVATRKKQN